MDGVLSNKDNDFVQALPIYLKKLQQYENDFRIVNSADKTVKGINFIYVMLNSLFLLITIAQFK